MLVTILFSFIFSWWIPVSPKEKLADETYQIIFVQGTIVNKSTGANLARGAKLSATDKVSFKSKDAKAVILSTKRGRFVMTGKPSASGNEFIAFVNDVVSPLKTNSKLSTRGIGKIDDKGIQDMKTHFGIVKNDEIPVFAILGDEYSFKVDIAKYPMNSEKILGIYYEAANKKVGKAIAFKGNVATLSKDGHFTKAGVDPADVNFVEIRPFDKAKRNFDVGIVNASFKPIFIDKVELKASFQEFMTLTGDKDATLRDYMKSALKYENEEEKANKEKSVDEKVTAMNEAEKKQELLFYFLASCYGQMNADGVIAVDKFNVDGAVLENWLKENNL